MAKSAIFRVDGGATVGFGHLVRCGALAGALHDLGWRCGIAGTTITLDAIKKLNLVSNSAHLLQLSDGLTGDQEAAQLRSLAPLGCDAFIVDHYQRDAAFHRRFAGWAEQIVTIHDMPTRAQACDVLIDTAVGRSSADWRPFIPSSARTFLGPQFALLRDTFAPLRWARGHPLSGPMRRCFVAVGATDPRGLLPLVIASSSLDDPLGTPLELEIIISSSAPSLQAVIRAAQDRPNTTLHIDPEHPAQIMARCDGAVSAAGSAAFELAVLGVPTLLLVTAENQKRHADGLQAAGMAQVVDLYEAQADLPARIEGALGRFLQDETGRRERAFAALKACDGLGARRIASALNGRRETKNGCEITLRSMTSDDGDWLLQLQRQPSTREFARNRAVPNPTEHVAWLRAKLNDPAVILNVIEVNENRVGFVRLEHRGVQSGGGFEVSVAIEPTSNGLGIGSGALALVHELVPAERLWAFVMPENVASQRLFHRAGYLSHREPNWWTAEPLVGKAPHN